MMRISLRVISAVVSRENSGIVAHDADSTPSDLSRPIARFNPDRSIARFNPDRPISLFMPRRHLCGLAWPCHACALSHVTSAGPTRLNKS